MSLSLPSETEARILRLAAERGISAVSVLEIALDTLPAATETPEQEQERLHREFEALLEEARLVSFSVPDEPPHSTQERTPKEAEYGRIITEKFQRQGFNV